MKRVLGMMVLLGVSMASQAGEWWVYRNHQCEPAAYTPDELVKIQLSSVLLDQPADGWKVLAGREDPNSLIYFGRGQESCERLGKAADAGQLTLHKHG